MEGRRVTHSAPKRNPLYVLFLCLIAAVFVLLVVVIVLSAKLGATQKALDSAKEQIEELQKSTVQIGEADPSQSGGQDEPDAPEEPDAPVEPDEPETPDEPDTPEEPTPDEDNKNLIGWLDLTNHGYLAVKPSSVYDRYYTYYAAEAVNLRSGPSTNYTRLLTIERGAQIQAAAKEGQWSFVLVNGKYGWVKTEFLSTSPIEVTSGSLTP